MPRTLRFSILCGIFSLILGAFILAQSFSFYLDTQETLASKSLGKVGVILLEILLSFCFSFFAFFLWQIKSTIRLIAGLGILRLMIFASFMLFFWEKAWWFIIDINGAQPFAFLLLLLSLGQIIGLLFLYRIKD